MVDSNLNNEEIETNLIPPSMLTTIDNPFNPFTQFLDWYGFDVSRGYNSLAYLARIVKDSYELSDSENALAYEKGMDEIIKYNPLGIYLKVTAESFKDRSQTAKIDTT